MNWIYNSRPRCNKYIFRQNKNEAGFHLDYYHSVFWSQKGPWKYTIQYKQTKAIVVVLPFVLLHPIFKSAMMLLFLLGKYPYYYSKSKCNGRKEGRRKKLGKDVLCPTFSPLTDRTSTLQIRSSQHRDFTSLNFFKRVLICIYASVASFFIFSFSWKKKKNSSVRSQCCKIRLYEWLLRFLNTVK